jgi:hypothetical protein
MHLICYYQCKVIIRDHTTKSRHIKNYVTVFASSVLGKPSASANCEGGKRTCKHLLRYGTKSPANTLHMTLNRSCSCTVKLSSSALQNRTQVIHVRELPATSSASALNTPSISLRYRTMSYLFRSIAYNNASATCLRKDLRQSKRQQSITVSSHL